MTEIEKTRKRLLEAIEWHGGGDRPRIVGRRFDKILTDLLMVACPECGGKGRQRNVMDLDHDLGPCPTCNGTGRISREYAAALVEADVIEEPLKRDDKRLTQYLEGRRDGIKQSAIGIRLDARERWGSK